MLPAHAAEPFVPRARHQVRPQTRTRPGGEPAHRGDRRRPGARDGLCRAVRRVDARLRRRGPRDAGEGCCARRAVRAPAAREGAARTARPHRRLRRLASRGPHAGRHFFRSLRRPGDTTSTRAAAPRHRPRRGSRSSTALRCTATSSKPTNARSRTTAWCSSSRHCSPCPTTFRRICPSSRGSDWRAWFGDVGGAPASAQASTSSSMPTPLSYERRN